MMNKTIIDWCDFTWNPVTGCLYQCRYCYARKMGTHFGGDIRINKGSDQLEKVSYDGTDMFILRKPFKNASNKTVQLPAGFAPTFHEYRLPMPAQMKKPANIFVCSMADLFGDWIPDDWIDRVFDACAAAPWHNYLFLTKNPKRMIEMGRTGRLPIGANYWYGSTVTNEEMEFFVSPYHNCFLSIEPLLSPIVDTDGIGFPQSISWIIIGAETGNQRDKVKPKREWVENLVNAAHEAGVPVHLKGSRELREVWGDELIQECPEILKPRR